MKKGLKISALIALILALQLSAYFCMDYWREHFADRSSTAHLIEGFGMLLAFWSGMIWQRMCP